MALALRLTRLETSLVYAHLNYCVFEDGAIIGRMFSTLNDRNLICADFARTDIAGQRTRRNLTSNALAPAQCMENAAEVSVPEVRGWLEDAATHWLSDQADLRCGRRIDFLDGLAGELAGRVPAPGDTHT